MPVQKSRLSPLAFLACLLLLIGLPAGAWAKQPPTVKSAKNAQGDRMSAMGHMALRARAVIEATQGRLVAKGAEDDNCINKADCEGEEGEGEGADGPAGGQAEVSIAVDSSGQHVVIGFNDTRGFALNPASVSGYMYSDDGGVTFTDGGQLPTPGND